jgi:MinD-like ATPase involved in chromosome partitioning or flagellar assembly
MPSRETIWWASVATAARSGPDPVEPPLLGASEQDATGQALTAQRVASLARRQTPRAAVMFIANRVQREQDVRRVEELVGESVFASLPADEGVAAAERIGAAPIDHAPDSPTITAIELLIAALARLSSSRRRSGAG